MFRTYAGSCHCGAIRFEVDADISAGTGKCNCSICRKVRLWAIHVTPESFRLLAGHADLSDYMGRNAVAHHFFCPKCGVHPFDRVDMPNKIGFTYFNINIACLDGVDVDELMSAPVKYYDGANDAWHLRPDEVRHL